MHLNDLAAEVKKGVEEIGLVGYRFNTIGVSDGISMGTDGMSYSLQSRDIIADSIETVMSAQWYDANISLPGCDKNMPGTLMAMARVNRPSLMIYGGTIQPGHSRLNPDAVLDIVSAFQCYGAWEGGVIEIYEVYEQVPQDWPRLWAGHGDSRPPTQWRLFLCLSCLVVLVVAGWFWSPPAAFPFSRQG